mgnify:CR=1 FL=1
MPATAAVQQLISYHCSLHATISTEPSSQRRKRSSLIPNNHVVMLCCKACDECDANPIPQPLAHRPADTGSAPCARSVATSSLCACASAASAPAAAPRATAPPSVTVLPARAGDRARDSSITKEEAIYEARLQWIMIRTSARHKWDRRI